MVFGDGHVDQGVTRAIALAAVVGPPMVGVAGTTVGEALAAMMEPGGQFIRQLDRLGQGLVEAHGLLAVPVVGSRLAAQARRAYHQGFVAPLAQQPRRVIFSVVRASPVFRSWRASARGRKFCVEFRDARSVI